MKKIFIALLVLAVALSVVVGANGVAFAEVSDNYTQTEEYEFLQDFVTNCHSRYNGSDEIKAAEYLKDKFDAVLAEVGSQATVQVYGTPQTEQYCNVIAELKINNKDQQMIIGAHFDAVGEGANDNGSGVTALYFIMRNFVANRAQLPCNVVFVAFGGEERGLLGSNQYVANMSAADKQNTLLMINIDSIVNGDNLYLFCENKSTSLAKLFLQNDLGKTILEKPYANGTYALDMYGYGYYETVQASDHTPFRLAEIPTALFFSGNFRSWDYVESTNPDKNTMNTNADTLENLNVNGALITERIDSVVSTIQNTVCSGEFYSVAENARSELMNNKLLFNAWWPRLLVLGLIVVLAVLAFFYHRKLVKKSILGTAEIKQTNVFSKPEAEDIFSFDDKKDDADDIFTYKK